MERGSTGILTLQVFYLSVVKLIVLAIEPRSTEFAECQARVVTGWLADRVISFRASLVEDARSPRLDGIAKVM